MSKNLTNSSNIKVLVNGDDVSLDFVNEMYTKAQADTLLNGKVNTQSGKGLSTNDFTSALKTKLDGIETGAQKNIIEKILVNGIEQTILNKKVNLMVENTTIYGIKRALNSNSSSAWERTDDAVNLVANATKDGSVVQNDFDNIYPWSDIITYNYDITNKVITAYYGDSNFSFDGSNGEVLTMIPEFYWKRYRDDTYEYIKISKYAIDGFIKSPAFSVGRYDTSLVDSKSSSRSGVVPDVSRNITSFRNLAKALGDGFGQLDYHYFLLQLLYLVEYADYNTQSKLGSGLTNFRVSDSDKALLAESSVNRIIIETSRANYFVVGQQMSIGTSSAWNWSVAKNRTITSMEAYDDGTITGTAIYFDGDAVDIAVGNVIWTTGQKSGQCDSLGMRSGCLANNGKSAIIYRGIENFFGNVYQFVDGINIKDNQAYICYSQENYVVDTFTSPYEALGYVNGNANGWAKSLGYDEEHPLISLTTEVGGSNSTYMSDYYYQNSGNRIAFVGGFYYTTHAGAWYWNLNSTSGNANINVGSRLLKIQS